MSVNLINEGILNLHYDNNLLYSNISLKISGKGIINNFNNNYDYNGIGLQILNNSINNKELNIINTSNLYNSNFSILNFGINNENTKIKSIYSNNLINLLNINNNINITSNTFSLGQINNTSNFNINGNIFLNSNLIFNDITINSTILNNSNILNFKDTSININSSNLIINNNIILGANIYKTDGTLYITEDILNFINTQWSNVNNSSNIYYNKGNIGIGISTIISSLDISSSLSNSDLTITLQNNESNNNFLFKKDNFNNGILWNFENNDLIFGTFNRERLRIFNSGNIGVGTNNPQSLLDIRSNIFIDGLLLNTEGNSYINVFWSNINNNINYNFGNIGINNNNPQGLLDINNGNLIINNGNLGIGTNNPISQLHLSTNNSNNNTIYKYNISNILSNLTFIPNTNDAFISFTSGTTNITFNDNIICDILVVGGGGGGGSWYVGGGGGGGEVKFISNYLILSGINYNITIGNGGAGGLATGDNENGAKNGESTIFYDIIASGGGAGGTIYGPGAGDGKNGACGGGAGFNYSAGTGNPGKNGGAYGTANGSTIPYNRGGGGGGMGTDGSDKGGNGVEYNITGSNIYYGGGGGAGADGYGYSGGLGGGGDGGGGNQGGSTASSGSNGKINTGGGGGGAGGNSQSLTGGNGGSGIVIIRIKNIYNNTSLILNDFSTGYNINNGLILEKKFNNSGFLCNYENADLIFGTSNQERIRIKNNGNIGIGTNNPIDLLDIRGNIYISGTLTKLDTSSLINLYWSNINNNLYYNQGNVGIKTNNPISSLYINDGNFIINNGNITIGRNNNISKLDLFTSNINYNKYTYNISNILSNLTFISNTNDAFISFTSGSNSITFNNNIICDILIIGGGGSGGGDVGGGGGAGGVVYQKNVILNSGTYEIIVGNGGNGSTAVSGFNRVQGNNGNPSLIKFNNDVFIYNGISFEGIGGGGGGNYNGMNSTDGKDGGSGGGGSENNNNSVTKGGLATQGNTYYNGTLNISGGYNGSNGIGGTILAVDAFDSTFLAGGGGGAGGIANNANGGPGVQIDITGINTWYAAGGGGGSINTPAGIGGNNIGGDGHRALSTAIASRHSGINGTGSGGGGGAYYYGSGDNNSGGSGGSGIVIIRIKNIYEIINSNTSIQFTDLNTGYNSNNGLILQKNNSNNGILWNYENNDLIFGTSNQERFRIKNSGYIGIGTTNPQALLDIRGNLYISGNLGKLDGSSVGNLLWTQRNNNLYYNEGDIGIGTNNPLNKLNINNGNIIINNGNLGIGTNNPISQIHLYSSNINNDIKIQFTDNNTQNRTNNIKPWAMYFADDYYNNQLLDTSGNNRHATCSGNITKQTSSGNGAIAPITYISGDTSTSISFPSGSIPTNFTILSLTRYTSSDSNKNKRILQSQTNNWLHGHWDNKRGIAFYEGWRTQYGRSIGKDTDWLCFIGNNGIPIKNNILIDGDSYGEYEGGSGGNSYQLSVNIGYDEKSDWALSCVIIWDRNLTYDNMLLFNSLINDYIKKGIDIKNIIFSLFINQGLALIKNNINNCLLINYENNDLIFGTNNQERLRIKNSGYIGIGNSFPQDLLDIRGDFFISGTLAKSDGSSVGNLLWTQRNNNLYYNQGNIGINKNNQNDISKLLEYPPKAYTSTSAETTISFLGQSDVYYQKITLDNTNINYGIGDYEIYSSSAFNTTQNKNLLFDKRTDLFTYWADNRYDYFNGNFLGNNYIVNDGFKGEWIIIKLPEFINLSGFTFINNIYYTRTSPGIWRCYGSSNGINFYKIEEASNEETNIGGSAYNPEYTKILNSYVPKYNYIGFTINKLSGINYTFLSLSEIKLYGLFFNPQSLLEINNDNFIINNGNIGIGINNPISQLHLSSNINSDIILRLSDASTGFTSNDGLILEKDVSQTGLLWNFENSDLIFGTSNQERLRIKNNGSIGIGTNNPNNILSINSNISSQELLLKNINCSNIIDNKINITSNILINYSNTINRPNLSVYALNTSLNSKENNLIFNNPLNRNNDIITLSTDNTTLFIDNNVLKIKNPERWTIVSTSNIYNNNSGNVGIGTTSPTQIFQIGSGNNSRLRIANSINDYTIIGSSDNNDTNEKKIILYGNNNINKNGSIEYYTTNNHNFSIINNFGNSVYVKSDYLNIFYIDSVENKISISLGTPFFPYEQFSVSGDIRLSGNLLKNDGSSFIPSSKWSINSSNLYYNNGSVAIGKTTHDNKFKLEVINNSIIGREVVNKNAYNHSLTPLTITNINPTSSFILTNSITPVLNLCREGTLGQSFGSRATFKICRYENNSTNSRTRIDLDLSHDSYNDSNIITIRSDKKIGIGNSIPLSTLDINGDIRVLGNILDRNGLIIDNIYWNQNNNNIYNIIGNIGISNINPLSKISIGGDIKLSGNIINNSGNYIIINSNNIINSNIFYYDTNNNLNVSNFNITTNNYIQPTTNPIINQINLTNNFSYIQFTNNNNITFNTLTIADLIIVGAGGNGALGAYSGGGGAGEVIFYPNFIFNTGSYSFNIGISSSNPINRISKISYNNNDIISAFGGGDGGGLTFNYSITGSGTYSSLTFISGINDTYISFTSGTNTITFTNNIICDILIVGGGGAGGGDIGGGGGAGGVVYQKNVILNSGSYEIIVGNGGSGSTGNTTNNSVNGNNGSPSQIKFNNNIFIYNGISFEGKGGGGGGNYNLSSATAGNNGGSGGGGSDNNDNTVSAGGSTTQGNTYFNGITNVQGGYAGSSGPRTTAEGIYIGGGGGGAGGTSGTSDGGAGIQNDITGVNTWYAAGGGGGSIGIDAGKGGNNIGGDGHRTRTTVIASKHSGTNGTGSGGGGGAYYYGSGDDNGGGSGGSGIVIIRIKNCFKEATNGNLTLRNNLSFTITSKNYYSSYYETNSPFRYLFFEETTNLTISSPILCDIIIVGGGGGGGSGTNGGLGSFSYTLGGGGGAGAVLYKTNYILIPGFYTIGIGSGGSVNNNGGDTSIYHSIQGFIAIAKGGGAGGNSSAGNNGGSSGGGALRLDQSGIFSTRNWTTYSSGSITTSTFPNNFSVYNNIGGTAISGVDGNAYGNSAGGGGASSPANGYTAGNSIYFDDIFITNKQNFEIGKGGFGVDVGINALNGSVRGYGCGGDGGSGAISFPFPAGTGSSGVVIIRYLRKYDNIYTDISGSGGGGFYNNPNITFTGTNNNIYEVINDNNSNYIIFSSSGTLTINKSIICDILVVGAGGSGGYFENNGAGGGGAGAVVYGTNYTLNPNTYNINIGTGSAGNKGGNTTFMLNTTTLISAIGGGPGQRSSTNFNLDGGCGGGGYTNNTFGVKATTNIVPQNFTLYSNNGGSGSSSSGTRYGGGGGGAGSAGGNALVFQYVGTGGSGITINITGTNYVYSKGGDGKQVSSISGANGTNYGDGGGATDIFNTGIGAQGVVIIRFHKKYYYDFYTNNDYNIINGSSIVSRNSVYSLITSGKNGSSTKGGDGGSALSTEGYITNITGTSLTLGVGGSGATATSIAINGSTFGSGGSGNGGLGANGVIIIRYSTLPLRTLNITTNNTNINNLNCYYNLSTNNNVGLLTNSPGFPLEISSSTSENFFSSQIGMLQSSGSSAFLNVYQPNISIKANGSILTSSVFIASSDERIKKNINDINDNSALDKILKIEPKTYNYIDYISKGTKNVFGFIAQQINEYIPEAITIKEEYIPNIYKNGYINNNNIICNENLLVNINDDIRIISELNGDNNYIITDIISSNIFKINKELDNCRCLIYGTKINDFHTLDKNYIYTLNVCATQELYKLTNTNQEKIDNIKNKINQIKEIIYNSNL